MEINLKCFINIALAALALVLYIIGSYRFYKNQKGFTFILGLAIFIDVLTAILASLRITPTVQIPGAVAVPWHSLIFKVHVLLSMVGFVGFILLFIYLIIKKPLKYKSWIRKWQFIALMPIWVVGECIALSNAIMKISCGTRLFDI